MTYPASHLQPLSGNNSQAELDVYWMTHALALAKRAQSVGEIPVGAVIVKDNQLIAEGFNNSITTCDPSGHAEMVAIRQAGVMLKNYRLVGCKMYITLEPCSMCAGAMVHARLQEIIFATPDLRTGAAGSVINLLQNNQFNHQVNIRQGVLADTARSILIEFFKEKRRSS
jgi:tRNA(adenine34) deaminase